MSSKSKASFTKEEELLLQDFSRNVSTKSSALFYGNAFIVSAIPICKYTVIENRYTLLLRPPVLAGCAVLTIGKGLA